MLKRFLFMFLSPSIRVIFIFTVLMNFLPQAVFAAEGEKTKKSTTQQIGGLLFDVDEGVKLEQGAGGSVYMKSNKEYMQEKITDIETRLTQLETKAGDFESRIEKLEIKNDPEAAQKVKESMPASESDESRRVLVT